MDTLYGVSGICGRVFTISLVLTTRSNTNKKILSLWFKFVSVVLRLARLRAEKYMIKLSKYITLADRNNSLVKNISP